MRSLSPLRRPAAVAAVAGVAVLAGCGGHSRSTEGSAGGVVSVVDRTWHCTGPVHLSVLRVTMRASTADAVHLDDGCTGTIAKLEIEGAHGDGVKIHRGAHDLSVGGGFVDCGTKAEHKHQDAIQAMGGRRIAFRGIVSRGCANSFMFVNSGRRRRSLPTSIVCSGCRATTRNYSVFVGRSVASGIRGGTFSSRVRPRATDAAVEPLLGQAAWSKRA
jgi:hypothetical protein